MANKQGGNTGSIESSPARRKRQADKRRREEARWAAKSGPVVVKKADPAPSTNSDD